MRGAWTERRNELGDTVLGFLYDGGDQAQLKNDASLEPVYLHMTAER